MAGIGQYLKETQGELRHVAWPTRTQTIVYTVLVALLSVGVALYLGLFDFLFTSGLARLIEVLPTTPSVTVTPPPSPNGIVVTPTPTPSPTPAAPTGGSTFQFDGSKQQ